MYQVLQEVAIADSTPTRYSEAELSALSKPFLQTTSAAGDSLLSGKVPDHPGGSLSAYKYVLQSKFLPSDTAAPDFRHGSLSMWGASDIPFPLLQYA